MEISGKNTVSENKLCAIFVANVIKELSEVFVAVQLSYSDIMLNSHFSVS